MISRVRSCYSDIFRWENLYAAFIKAAKGKRGRGPVAAFEFHLEDNLVKLQEELAKDSYQPGAYVNFSIHEPKERLISAAPFRDRVVHHALCQVIEPAFEGSFIRHSYANRLGKGTHRALDACQRWMRSHRYVLACDVRQFFPSVDHQILLQILFRRVQDGGIRRLIRRIVQSGIGVLKEAYDSEGIRFLGFVVYPTHRLLLRRKGIHYRRRLHRLLQAYRRRQTGRDRIEASIRGWINHVRYADTWGLRRSVLKDIRL